MDTNYEKQEIVNMLQQKNTSHIKQEGEKFQQYFCTIIASIGAMIIGCVLAWTSPTKEMLENINFTAPLHVTPDESCWIAAWTPIGAIFGALPAGLIANTFGRKLTLIGFTVPIIGMWITISLTTSVILLYVARFVIGIIIGLFCAVLPMYVNEIAEDSVRGSLGTLFQVFLTIGILFDYALGSFNSYDVINYGCTALTVLLFFMLFLIPESPVHLLKKNRRHEAEQVLKRLRGQGYDVNLELNEIRKTTDSDSNKTSFSSIFQTANVKALSISIGLMLGQQLSGINAVIFFAKDIFIQAGANSPNACTVILGVVQTIATLASSLLIDRFGRKMLLTASGMGMAASLLGLGYFFYLTNSKVDVSNLGWLPLISLVCFIIVFSLGFGPIPWMMGGELMAPAIKGFGSGLSVGVNWTCVAVVTFFFKPLSDYLTPEITFWIFSFTALLATLFVIFLVPETKGKSMQQIQNELGAIKIHKHTKNGNV